MENNNPTYAGFWLRFAALLIDGILTSILNAIIMSPLLGQTMSLAMRTETDGLTEYDIISWMTTFVFSNLSMIVLSWLYFALMESSNFKGSLGKRLVGLQVTTMDGQRIGFGRATGRYFGKILSAFILMIGYIMAGFTEKKQALHDILAGTLVVKR
ncbi:MAG: RDD family protein [Bacteroidetes bacterium]|nr:RDD family protein [Bacteroidota bacterium]